jgi:hypothetical protein
MTNRPLYLMLTAALAVTGAGCGSDDDDKAPGATKPSTTTSASAPATAPYGTYVRTVTKADLQRTAKLRDTYGPGQELPPAGRYRLVIARGAGQDVLKVTDPGDFTIGMTVTAEESGLFLSEYVDPAKGSFCGPEVAAAVAFRYTASSEGIELSPESADPCADRDSILTGTWKKG